MTTPTAQLSAAGVSIWLDDLSRQRIQTGNLADLIATRDVTGVTTNPTIFAGALSKGEAYEEQVKQLAAQRAITEVIGAGISVNVTLIFSLERYAEVIDAYLAGVEKAQAAGHDISTLHSVASFFVSRVDTEVDKRLGAIGTDDALALKSKAGLANARLAYELFEERFDAERATTLIAAGANVQRPLWASTGVKDPALPDTLYVTELVAAGTVNTMPEKTLQATFDHGVITGDTITGNYADAHDLFAQLAAVGVDFADVTQVLEDEGVEKFIASWHELQDTVTDALQAGTTDAADSDAPASTAESE